MLYINYDPVIKVKSTTGQLYVLKCLVDTDAEQARKNRISKTLNDLAPNQTFMIKPVKSWDSFVNSQDFT